ncbi:hypothetical protein Pdw03_4213 [Penicillium digitatum]|uniref:Uncharacterized protein n=3 Tax=Penicillium digitatum TaxID=36651 RepID=K9FJB9_PEND2|nr:hypothetical protein PDIP_72320 [Penicillium digitatum Pd1]EKV07739.1 hypothetical protein PDIP_72320 [Penicillium digitatum Pd1]EKV09344.1 hypothetical protein PDIG_62940 [Penicillium digitatum PHI26]KAG0159154.1 hypothetical protein PDIDSM_6675 [Penicillium digitatum]QQK41359.1 hypothetical protein Pdw03_4213 [Penicillium digitatum]
MALSNSAIIVIVLVACLAATALGASFFKHYKPADGETPFSPGHNQKVYMAEVRARGFDHLRQISWSGKDLESRYTPAGPGYYHPHTYTEDTNTYTKDTGSSA